MSLGWPGSFMESPPRGMMEKKATMEEKDGRMGTHRVLFHPPATDKN